MPPLIQQTREMLWRRSAPQDLPYSPTLLAVVLLLAVGLHLAILAATGSLERAALPVALSYSLGLGLPWLALRLSGRQARFVQTALALTLVEIAFGLLILPFLLALNPLPVRPEDVRPIHGLFTLWRLALLFWQIAVNGHILRHALDLRPSAGNALAFTFALIELSAVFAVDAQNPAPH